MTNNSPGTIAEIAWHIQAKEKDLSLYEENNFKGRAEAIDQIDIHIIDRIEILLQNGYPKQGLDNLKQRAEKIRDKLDKINIILFKRLRENIGANNYNRSSFKKMISDHFADSLHEVRPEHEVGYEDLDLFINGLLSDRAIPEETIAREPEMIFYQKTPARIIFQMAELAKLRSSDVFFDLGSGLGQVVMLMNLLSGVPATGIEYEPAYCAYAKIQASQLNLSNVNFIDQDTRQGDYSKGTVFFMYTPFEGDILQEMLEILQNEAVKRTIRIFTYGPCSMQVAQQRWLNCINGKADDPHKLYEFRSV